MRLRGRQKRRFHGDFRPKANKREAERSRLYEGTRGRMESFNPLKEEPLPEESEGRLHKTEQTLQLMLPRCEAVSVSRALRVQTVPQQPPPLQSDQISRLDTRFGILADFTSRALGVALVGQREAERASLLMLRLLQMCRDPPDEEPSRGEDGPTGTLLQLKDKLEDEVLPGERPQAAVRPVKGRGLVDWRERRDRVVKRQDHSWTATAVTDELDRLRANTVNWEVSGSQRRQGLLGLESPSAKHIPSMLHVRSLNRETKLLQSRGALAPGIALIRLGRFPSRVKSVTAVTKNVARPQLPSLQALGCSSTWQADSATLEASCPRLSVDVNAASQRDSTLVAAVGGEAGDGHRAVDGHLMLLCVLCYVERVRRELRGRKRPVSI
ncbi:hypothetical protein INR49_002705 [Caranx melampygus]|nr:hypothetical protein INR49_002705 [Caranx melampygus]